jgi:FtsP/CotA-like multicopper oxidase with cupredoxin domain
VRYSRGEFLRLGLVGGAGLFLPLGVSGCGAIPQGGRNVSTEGSAGAVLRSAVPLPEPFTVPLPVPPVLKPSRSDSTTDYYEITQRVGQAEILPDLKTEVWGYEGILPGPTVETRRGRRAVVSSVELWRIRAQNVEHPFHIHLAPFQVVAGPGGGDPGPYNAGWKDTVNLDNGGDVELLIRFDGYPGKYVFHCHNLEHEDMMMANFEVV